MKTVCLTGVAGFIGFHLAKQLEAEGYTVIGIDNLNSYYDQNLKIDRLSELQNLNKFEFLDTVCNLPVPSTCVTAGMLDFLFTGATNNM